MISLLAQVSSSGVPIWLTVILAAFVPLAAAVGHKLGVALVTSGSDYVEAQLKARKHDELVPVVEAFKHALVEGAHDATLEHLQVKAVENGSIDHPAVQAALQGGATS
jgi:hypothetical protein